MRPPADVSVSVAGIVSFVPLAWFKIAIDPVYTPASRQALPNGVSSAQQAAHPYTPKENSIGDMLGGAAGCFAALLILAFYAGCGLVVVAAIVWAWHYLFG